jgi:hypothetical protein
MDPRRKAAGPSPFGLHPRNPNKHDQRNLFSKSNSTYEKNNYETYTTVIHYVLMYEEEEYL